MTSSTTGNTNAEVMVALDASTGMGTTNLGIHIMPMLSGNQKSVTGFHVMRSDSGTTNMFEGTNLMFKAIISANNIVTGLSITGSKSIPSGTSTSTAVTSAGTNTAAVAASKPPVSSGTNTLTMTNETSMGYASAGTSMGWTNMVRGSSLHITPFVDSSVPSTVAMDVKGTGMGSTSAVTPASMAPVTTNSPSATNSMSVTSTNAMATNMEQTVRVYVGAEGSNPGHKSLISVFDKNKAVEGFKFVEPKRSKK
ncbi:MAG: hypothetical protein SGI71_10070 [Verrucomicrobiota bacterium]|nr:hypothetical protein [Verrucomicrobiota bacterium]